MPPLRLVLWLWSLLGWLSSLLGVWLGVEAMRGAPAPLAVGILAFVVHATLATAGVLLPGYGLFADVFARGSRRRAEVALTFDDGPHPETTPRVLELLRQHGAKATFFVLGEKARRYPRWVSTVTSTTASTRYARRASSLATSSAAP
jgi:peptidoglycan-N-acetylglucosamine deacetylase